MPKISVIIPCYNLGQYLDEAVDSILAQTFHDFEIIIVNDGSTDEFTNKLLAKTNKPKTRVITTDNQGLPAARNNGIKISSGQYICCLDADDKYHPKFLEKTVTILDKDAEHNYGFITTWFQLFGEHNFIQKTAGYDPYNLALNNLVHVASLFRRECWEKKGGYSTNLLGYQDWDFWIAIVSMGYKWYCIEEPLFFYRTRPNSMISESDKKRPLLIRQIIKNNIDFYTKNCEEIMIRYVQKFENYQSLAEKEMEIQTLKNLLNERNQEIQILKNSLSWKIIVLFKRFCNLFVNRSFY